MDFSSFKVNSFKLSDSDSDDDADADDDDYDYQSDTKKIKLV